MMFLGWKFDFLCLFHSQEQFTTDELLLPISLFFIIAQILWAEQKNIGQFSKENSNRTVNICCGRSFTRFTRRENLYNCDWEGSNYELPKHNKADFAF